MRRYTNKFVALRLRSRLNEAACPFPGKSPLRMLARNGDFVYNGKFNPSIWKFFWKRRGKNVTNQVYLIYDKAGAVITATTMPNLQTADGLIMYRYFGVTFVTAAQMLRMKPEVIGPYHLFLDSHYNHELGQPMDRTRWLHYVNTSVPHIRTV